MGETKSGLFARRLNLSASDFRIREMSPRVGDYRFARAGHHYCLPGIPPGCKTTRSTPPGGGSPGNVPVSFWWLVRRLRHVSGVVSHLPNKLAGLRFGMQYLTHGFRS